MQLTPDQVQALVDKLNTLPYFLKPCHVCRTGRWEVSDSVFELKEYGHGSLLGGSGSLYLVAPITCSNCGHTVLMNAIKLGLVFTGLTG